MRDPIESRAARRSRSALLCGVVLGWACSSEAPSDPPDEAFAGTTPQATLALERELLGLGDVTAAELAIAIPAGATVQPAAAPEIPGLWLLERENLVEPVAPDRWVHRTRYRVRAREIGVFVWPESQRVIERADGERELVRVPAVEFEVGSTVDAFPARDRPFGLLSPEERTAPLASRVASFAAGFSTAIAGLGLVWLVRRKRRHRNPTSAPAHDEKPTEEVIDPLSSARDALAAIREHAQTSPLEAAHRTATLLRVHAGERYGIDALPLTLEQLRDLRVPLAARRYWPDWLRALRTLDALRFRAGACDSDALARSLDEVEALLERSHTSEVAR